MGKDWRRRGSNHNNVKEIEIDRLYLEEGERKHHRMFMTGNPQGKREQGRPKQSLGLTMTNERNNTRNRKGVGPSGSQRAELWWSPSASRAAKRSKYSNQ